ncbi:MAG: BON domain-containing protein [Sulfurimonas sp.]
MSSNKTTKEEASLEEALSPLVNRLIDKNYKSSKDKIALQMAPLMGSAIRKQIKSQKDDIVDALYPVVGNMISRYVTKMFEDMLKNINNQIQSGLSFKTLKRKLTAKLRGISESELLFSENATAQIEALFLIHKETGTVLVHVENPNYPVSEPEMLASMMTAIRSFVNDWVEKNSEHQELAEIEYGDKKIIIESSGYSYLAAIVRGNTNKSIYDKIRETLENIVFNHGEDIQKFNGDVENFPNIPIYKEVSQLLSSHDKQEQETKKAHPLLFILPLIIFIFTGFYLYKGYLDDNLMQKVNTTLYKTPTLTTFRLHCDADNGIVTLRGEVPFAYHKKLAQTLLENIEDIKEIKNEIIVADTLQDPMQVSANIAYLLKGFNAQEGINVTYSFNYNSVTLHGTVWDKTLKQKIFAELNSLESIEKIVDEIKISPPKIDTAIYFEKDSTQLDVASQAKLITLLTLLKNSNISYDLLLSSFSDQIGTIKRNRVLSHQRLKKVSGFLKNQGQIKNRLILNAHDTPPQGIDATTEPKKARCVIISYAKKDNNVSI